MESSALDLPDDICTALLEAFSDPDGRDYDDHARVLFFLSQSLERRVAAPYLKSLRSVIGRPAVFKTVANRLAEDTRKMEEDEEYREFMHDVWSNFLEEDDLSESDNHDNGQEWSLAVLQVCTPGTAEYAFISAVARLPQPREIAIYQIVRTVGNAGTVAVYTNRALRTVAHEVVAVGLVAACLAYDVIKNIRRWWRGEISGKRCLKNIIDCGVGVAAGLAGGVGGEMIGAAVGSLAGPLGTVVGGIAGAVVGGIGASRAGKSLSDRLTQRVFGLPKNEALDKAYKEVLFLRPNASNSEINSRYRQLCLIYHPDREGDEHKWTQLQYAMAVIREARGER
ncbi:uncharacterized protein [Amphiura filiformis]|uniref:uncharacterized protein n=1 Tax=Amphiura filiformis TaxID=82378 RepID=UPI003B22457B